jgi:DNA-directed RNA polymerase specialized sigma24 family protein
MGEKHSQFEALLLPHLDSAYNVAYWVIQNDADAQAIVQEGFAQAWQEFERSGEPDARLWLLSIILRIAHTRIRTQRKHSKESGPGLGSALSRLPVEFREILVLHDAEGWTYRQLATALEISPDTVASRLSMARSVLRKELGG